MLTKYVLPGDRVELQAIERSILGASSGKKMYSTKVYDLLSEERVEIMMPIEQVKLVLLPLDGEYELIFYTRQGLYQCFARVIDRYKSNNFYLAVYELTSELRKHQRREYYRFSTVFEVKLRLLEEEEIQRAVKGEPYIHVRDKELSKGTIVDISGGGCRFISENQFEKDSLIYLSYSLMIDGVRKTYEITAMVVNSQVVENKRDKYEHRVKYMQIRNGDREEIIRYIFGEERKNRQKLRG